MQFFYSSHCRWDQGGICDTASWFYFIDLIDHAVRRMFQSTTKINFVDKRFWFSVNRVSNCELKKGLIVHAFGSNHLDQPYQGFCTKVTVLIIDVTWMRH